MRWNKRPASVFQQYWSLAIEEQFYLVYPALFVFFLGVTGWWSPRIRLSIGISIVVIASFIVSVHSSHPGHLGAYYSPLTRAWELGIGGLLAVCTEATERLDRFVAAVMTWIGLIVILVSAWTISLAAAYPGWIAAVPVLGTALVIAGGTAVPPRGAEAVLGTTPFRKVGQWSYSWYLWHWPLLVIAAEAAHTTVLASSIAKNLLVVLIALGLSVLSYLFIENPIRRSRRLRENHRLVLVGAAMLIVTCIGFTFAF